MNKQNNYKAFLRAHSTILKGTVVGLVFFITSIITACDMECSDFLFYQIVDVTTVSMDIVNDADGTTAYVETDTISHQLAFKTHVYVEIGAAKPPRLHGLGLVNVAYGCGESELTDPIDAEASHLSTNRTLVCSTPSKTITIEANENLLDYDLPEVNFPTHLNFEEDAITTIQTDGQLLFQKEEDYEFYFEWQTVGGTVLRDTVQVHMSM